MFCIDPWIVYMEGAGESGAGVPKPAVGSVMTRALETEAIVHLFFHNIRAAGCADIVRTIRGTSDAVLPFLKEEQFDIAFVDGSHTYEHVRRDILNTMPLVAEGGFICGDDLELQAHEIDSKRLRETYTSETSDEWKRDYVVDDATGIGFHPGVTLAVAECFEGVSAWEGFWVVQKQGKRWESLGELDAEDLRIPDHLRSRRRSKKTCGSPRGG